MDEMVTIGGGVPAGTCTWGGRRASSPHQRDSPVHTAIPIGWWAGA
jgi:hypothetical protein